MQCLDNDTCTYTFNEQFSIIMDQTLYNYPLATYSILFIMIVVASEFQVQILVMEMMAVVVVCEVKINGSLCI